MSLSLFWSISGQETELDPMPESLETWTAGSAQELNGAQKTLVRAVEKALSIKIVRVDLLAQDSNLVVKVEYESGQQDVVRTPCIMTADNKPDPLYLERFLREVDILKWLKANTAIPVPEIRQVIDASNPETYPYVIMEKLPGSLLLNAAGRLPYPAKERLMHAHAEVMLELFRLDVPQRIGTMQFRDGMIEVVPWKAVNPASSATSVYDTLEDFIDGMIQLNRRSNRIGTDAAARLRGEKVLSRLASKLSPLCERYARPSHRRCVLVHDDLNQTNVLVDSSGNITGVIDWEYQSIRPALLAAEYPPCIRYDGLLDPRLRDNDGSSWWTVSPQDAAQLRDLYAQIVKAKDHEYWEALVDGELIRHAVDWLTSSGYDEGCADLERLMEIVFPCDG